MIIDLFEAVRTNPQYFKQLQCAELLFTQYDCPQSDAKQDLFSECSFVVYVLDGKRIFHFPGESLDLSKGACAFVKKGGWIAEKVAGAGWCVMVFFIPDHYLKGFISEYRQGLPLKNLPSVSENRTIALDVNPLTRHFFQSMFSFFTEPTPPPKALLALKFKELLLNLLMNTSNKNLLSWISHLSDAHLPPLGDIMESNYTFNLSLTEFARISGRSLATFKREFKSLYKTSPGVWLKKKRLDYAGLLLATSSKRVSDVCFESGFENTTHFSKEFKQKFGISALQYRSNHSHSVADK